MIHPSYSDLMKVMNTETEEDGEEPMIQSRYSIVIAAAKRARQLIEGDEPLVSGAADRKPLSVAVDELYQGKVKILSCDEDDEDDDMMMDYNNNVLDTDLGEDVDEVEYSEDDEEEDADDELYDEDRNDYDEYEDESEEEDDYDE